jgi:hypothetical protein
MRPSHLATLLAVLIATPALAAPAACPASLKVTQKASEVPDGFKVFADGNPPLANPAQPALLPLETILFSEGPPTDQGWLTPDARRDLVAEWHFATAQDENVWISCAYQATTLMISMPLPPGLKTCRVRSVKDETSPPTLLCDDHP